MKLERHAEIKQAYRDTGSLDSVMTEELLEAVERLHTALEINRLVKDNRNLNVTVALIRINDLEKEMRELQKDKPRDPEVASLKEEVDTLKGRLDTAGVKFKEMQEAIDALQKPKEPREPDEFDPASGGGEF